MTSVTIFQNQHQQYIGFACQGHAGYADQGEDIVCAGISALVITVINALDAYTDEQFTTRTNEETGLISVRFRESVGHDAQLLIKTLVLGLEGIQSTYGNDYISLTFKEV